MLSRQLGSLNTLLVRRASTGISSICTERCRRAKSKVFDEQDIAAEKRRLRNIHREVPGYFTFGQYDGAEIIEAPNDEFLLCMALSGPPGMVRTSTDKAFPLEEVMKSLIF